MSDKRKDVRRPMTQPVAILASDGSLVCECTLRDVSDTGARLKLDIKEGSAVPDIAQAFILSLSRRGNIFRQCELVWQRDGEVGVRFIAPRR